MPLALFALAACGGTVAKPEETIALEEARQAASRADVAELEIRSDGTDRFLRCPPSPALPNRTLAVAPASERSDSLRADATHAASSNGEGGDGRGDASLATNVPSWRAAMGRTSIGLGDPIAAVARNQLRRCVQRARLYGGDLEGRVDFALKLAEDGQVEDVQTEGACQLSREALACMRDVAKGLRFAPQERAGAVVVLPAVFFAPSGPAPERSRASDAYTAAAFITAEQARPALHACESAARKVGRPPFGRATFELELAPDGRVRSVRIEPWTGDRELIACAARSMKELRFEAPPAGRGQVWARVSFNPRGDNR